jgi:hypothetical protein
VVQKAGEDAAHPLKPQRVIADLRRAMADDDVLVCDVGAHKLCVARLFQAERPNTCIISNGFASMGIALPGALAAKLALPERRVVAVSGDGGFLMNSQELETRAFGRCHYGVGTARRKIRRDSTPHGHPARASLRCGLHQSRLRDVRGELRYASPSHRERR